MPFVVSKFRCFVVFPLEHHLPHLREDARDVRSLEMLVRHEYAFVAEGNLLRVGVAGHIDVDRAIAGDQKRIGRRCDAAEAPPRHNPAPQPFFERHRRDSHAIQSMRLDLNRRLGQRLVCPRAPQIFGGTNLL